GPVLAVDLRVEVPSSAGPRRDQVADDDVLLQPDQLVAGTPHRRVRQHARRLLERRRADERLRGQARLRDPEEQRLRAGRPAALGDDLLVRLAELDTIHVLALEIIGVARVRDAHLLQHLPDDDTDVLVVDLHALEAVDLLDLVEQVLLHRTGTLDPQDVVRIHRPLAEAVAGADLVTLVHAQVLPDRDFVNALRSLLRHDDDLALAATDLAEADRAVDLRDDGRILGTARLEELRHPRQTARDVAGLVDLAADLGERLPGLDRLAIPDDQLRAHRDDELTQLLAVLLDLDHRVQLLVPILDDHELTAPGRLVELFAHRLVLDDVDELHGAAEVRDDRLRVRIPAEEQVARLDFLPVLDGQGRAVGDGEAAANGALLRLHHDLALAARDDPFAVGRLDEGDALERDLPIDLRLPLRLRGNARRGAADVEGPQRELRA